ncbi:MAG: transglutaminase domain-containing protein [Cyclobacteriaceae bacterium]|nr:transglutaminase domain-containing protein [Cyclobacteriaceae bacterium]
MKRYFLFIVFVFIGTVSYSQGKEEVRVFNSIHTSEVDFTDFAKTDADQAQITLNALLLNVTGPTSISYIALLLTKSIDSQVEKVRSIYSWIALHITYDSAALSTGKVPDQSPEATLQRRNAVCEGFARLFVRHVP